MCSFVVGRVGGHQEGDPRVPVALLPHDGPGQTGRRAGGRLDDEYGARREQWAQESGQRGSDLRIAVIRRVRKEQSISRAAAGVSPQGAARVGGEHAGARSAPVVALLAPVPRPHRHAQTLEIGAQRAQRGALVLDERAGAGATRERLDAEGAGAGEEVEDDVTAERAGGGRGISAGPHLLQREERPAPPLPADDPHGRPLATPAVAGPRRSLRAARRDKRLLRFTFNDFALYCLSRYTKLRMTNLELDTGTILLAIVINLPFGAYRATVRRFSWQWFLAIHLPIPFVILMRLSFGLGWWFVPFMLARAVTGQLLGSWLFNLWRARRALSQAQATE